MKKIDKTLKEVRAWKRKVAAKTRRMTREQTLAYFHAAKNILNPPRRRRVA